jgi:lysylphosphatidylglycerol synthetase-like protein (DUF2156 family)
MTCALFLLEQPSAGTSPYTSNMKFGNRKVTSALWVIALCVVGLAFGVTSVAGWTILAGLALLPLIFVPWMWSDPRQTMSESIQQARR